MNYMFYQCESLEEPPLLDTQKVTNMQSMFEKCTKLKRLPAFDTGKVSSCGTMLQDCTSLVYIPELNATKMTSIATMFKNCTALTDFGGLNDFGASFTLVASANYGGYTLDLSTCTNLTHDSLMNVINKLHDIATRGCKTQKLVLGSDNLNKLTSDEVAIATNKGWTVS